METGSTRWLKASWRSRRAEWARVHGFSMAPTLASGDWIRVAPPSGAPSVGQMVVIPLGERLVAHRVVAVGRLGVVTRGDACAASDPAIPVASVLGRVVEVRRSFRRRVRAWLGGSRWRTT